MLREFRIAAVFAALLALSGCGIKGPLYLPPAQATAASAAPAPPAAVTAPAPPPAAAASAPTAATPADATGTAPKKP
jgi:predicted small lipoprotein YifL